MTSLSSLMDYYYEFMYPELKILEKERLSIIARLKKAIFILAVFGLGLCFFLIRSEFLVPLHAFIFSAMLSFLVYMFIYRHETSGYKLFFKDQIIEKIIHFIDASLVYDKMDCIQEKEFRRSGIFPQDYDRYSGNDLVQGTIDGVNVRFSDLHVEEKHRTKNGKEEWHTLFQGLFLVADFNKDFRGATFVFPDFAQRSLGLIGEWIQSLNTTKGELIKLDHTEFEKLFVVYGDDQIESRYILSHALMEKIVEFQKKTGKQVSLSFVHSQMYLCVDYKKELFEPILSQSLLEFVHIQNYFELLAMIIGIVDTFKLNEKIWSKQ